MTALLILVPLLGLFILNLPFKQVMRKAAFPFAFLIFIAQICIALLHHPHISIKHFDFLNVALQLAAPLDVLSFVALLCIGIVSLSSLLVARYTIHNQTERFRFFNLLVIASIGMSGMVMVKDIFSLYVFLEVTAIASFILIAFKKHAEGLEGAFKYLVLSSIATIFMLTATALFLLVAGGTSFASIHEALLQNPTSHIILLAVGLFIVGLLIKSGVFPFHFWVPDAYSAAPHATSILLAGIATKVGGVYALMRIVITVFGFIPVINKILLLLGILSIVAGALGALGQTNFKRLLSYSSISQVGYIIIGLGTGSFLGIFGALFHFFNHAIFKSLLFTNAAAVETQTGVPDLDNVGGLAEKMPVTGATSVIGVLSTSGIPPFAGFWSKIIIIIALWQTNHYFYAVIAVLASVLTLAYLLYMQNRAFFGKLKNGLEGTKEAAAGINVVAIALASITLAIGIFFPVVTGYLLALFAGLIP